MQTWDQFAAGPNVRIRVQGFAYGEHSYHKRGSADALGLLLGFYLTMISTSASLIVYLMLPVTLAPGSIEE